MKYILVHTDHRNQKCLTALHRDYARSCINISQNHGAGKNLKRLSSLFAGFQTSQSFQTDESLLLF